MASKRFTHRKKKPQKLSLYPFKRYFIYNLGNITLRINMPLRY